VSLEIKLTKDAAKFLNSRDRKTREAIKKHLAELADDPFSYPLSKPLRRRTERTCRVGDCRILFVVEEEGSALIVTQIGHRRDVYE
jgi:mRNA-degrading endonuclease RelE of RelBE toxin-antitoxin system